MLVYLSSPVVLHTHQLLKTRSVLWSLFLSNMPMVFWVIFKAIPSDLAKRKEDSFQMIRVNPYDLS